MFNLKIKIAYDKNLLMKNQQKTGIAYNNPGLKFLN